MEFIFEIGAMLLEFFGGILSNPYVVYAGSLLGVVLLFILRHIGQRLAEDIYKKIKGWVLALFGRKRKPESGELPGAVPRQNERLPGHSGIPAAASGGIPGGTAVAEERSPPQPVQKKYRTTAFLGSNTHVALYRALSARGEELFLKMAVSRAFNDWVLREAELVRRLNASTDKFKKQLPHPVDAFQTEDGLAVSVFEAIEGYNLRQIRERYPEGIPHRHSIWLWRRILAVLGHAHSQGILHGNIEPTHILVRPRDHNVWLIDWSYSIDNPARTGQTFRIHNPPYSPPEVTEKKPPLPSSDLYSVAQCILYVLGGDPGSGQLPQGLDARLERFLRQFLLSGQRARPQDAWEMYGRLDNLREEIYGPHEFLEFVM